MEIWALVITYLSYQRKQKADISHTIRNLFSLLNLSSGVKGDWDFQISDLVKNPDI